MGYLVIFTDMGSESWIRLLKRPSQHPLLIMVLLALSHIVPEDRLLSVLGEYLEFIVPGQSTALVQELRTFLFSYTAAVIAADDDGLADTRMRLVAGHRCDSSMPYVRQLRAGCSRGDDSCGVRARDMDSEQTTDQTFRVTSTPDGSIGVTVFVDGNPRFFGLAQRSPLQPSGSLCTSKLRLTAYPAEYEASTTLQRGRPNQQFSRRLSGAIELGSIRANSLVVLLRSVGLGTTVISSKRLGFLTCALLGESCPPARWMRRMGEGTSTAIE